jgi:hypothetical protein
VIDCDCRRTTAPGGETVAYDTVAKAMSNIALSADIIIADELFPQVMFPDFSDG